MSIEYAVHCINLTILVVKVSDSSYGRKKDKAAALH